MHPETGARAPALPAPFVKICGITRVEDALLCLEAGASAIGLNFIPSSRRRVDEPTARRIVDAVRGRLETVAVVADLHARALRELRARVGFDLLQLHGKETKAELEELLPGAFKAVRIGGPEDVRRAAEYGGERLLVDAYVPGELGGTGATFDWSLVTVLAGSRKVVLAGGLTKDNVGEALRRASPWGVDVASGVESSPGVKDPELVRAFVRAARSERG